MAIQEQTLFYGTPADLKEMMVEVVAPLVERIRELEITAAAHKHAYTTAEVGKLIGYTSSTVTSFIKEGRKARSGKMVRLPAKEITTGSYRILPADLDIWLSHF